MRTLISVSFVLAILAASAGTSAGQTLGSFRWQLQPYCNVVTVTITQVAGVYRLEGTDDQCGGGRDLAAVQGLAFPNPDGTIGFGLTIVTSPGGAPVHVDATIALASLGGSWRDSNGATGSFVFTPGGATAGNPRPAPQPEVPPAVQLSATGSIVASGALNQGLAPASGNGVRMMWYPGKSAFRAGEVSSTQWDSANIGRASAAFGSNTVASGHAALALGLATTASGERSVAMGWNTRADGGQSFAGGYGTVAGGSVSFAFGHENLAGGQGSVVLGGRFARTTAAAAGSFVFTDYADAGLFESYRPNEFGARFVGGYYLYTSADLSTGVSLAPNGSSWAALSDANSKENFRDVDGESLLAQLRQVPVREWNYKAQDRSIRHMGPTAQDFNAAFGLGDFPLRINTIDADGVALAGVKALEARTQALQAEVEILRQRLDALTAASPPLRER